MPKKITLQDRYQYHASRFHTSPFSFGWIRGYDSLDDKPKGYRGAYYEQMFRSRYKEDISKAKGFFAYFRDLKK